MIDQPEVFRVLFVCSGNTCRSPLAEALARRDLEARGWDELVEVTSAGTGAMHGATASKGSMAVAASVGLDLADHRSKPLTSDLVAEAHLILTMGTSHLQSVLDLGGEGRGFVISSFAEGTDEVLGWSVPDPFGGNLDIYMETLQTLEELVRRAVGRLEPQPSNGADT